MQILLCAATFHEIEPTLGFIREHEMEAAVAVEITGVGLAAACYRLTKAVCWQRPDLIVQAGIAGTLDDHLSLGAVVAVENEIIGDLGVEEQGQFRSVFDLYLDNPNKLPWQKGRLTNAGASSLSAGLPLVNSVTVNEISTNENRIAYYRKLGAQIESMEGAALHYVGLMEGISFLQLRGLSNFIGERDKSRWKMAEAIERLNQELQNFLTKMLKP